MNMMPLEAEAAAELSVAKADHFALAFSQRFSMAGPQILISAEDHAGVEALWEQLGQELKKANLDLRLKRLKGAMLCH